MLKSNKIYVMLCYVDSLLIVSPIVLFCNCSMFLLCVTLCPS